MAAEPAPIAGQDKLSISEEPADESEHGFTVTFPEGGRQAWSAVAGGWLVLFVIFGSIGNVTTRTISPCS
jgi:hypothetical protein